MWGNTDRSLSSEAVIYPGSITIIKEASPEGSTEFAFTASPLPLSDFILVDDGVNQNWMPFLDIREFQIYTVTENTPSGWDLEGIVCVVELGTENGGSWTPLDGTVTIDLKEGENVTCTFTNAIIPAPAISINKTTNGGDGVVIQVGLPVNWSYVVTNTGNVPLTSVSVTDDQGVTVTCPYTDLGVGESMTCTASGTAVVGTYSNIGTANGSYGSTPVTASDPSSYFGADPSIDIQKTPDTQTVIYGQTANFTIVVTNTGNVALTSVAVTDPLAPNCAATIGALAIGAYSTYTCSLANVTSGFTNVAYASGYYGTINVTDNDDAAVVVDILPDISVTKTANPTSVPETGGNVVFTFVVTNNSSEPFILNSLTDDRFGDLDGQGTCDVPQTIAAGGTYTCAVTKSLASDTLTAHINWVTASGVDEQGNPDSATDDATVTFTDVAPIIDVTKTANPTHVLETGGSVTFTFRITNTGPEDVTVTSILDDKFGDLLATAVAQNGGANIVILATEPDSYYEFTYTTTLSSDTLTPHTNRVDVIAVDEESTPATDWDTETVTFDDVAPTILVTKTPSVASVPETGGNVTFTFTVQNTSSEEAVTILSLSDSIYGTLAGDADCMVGTVLAASATCEFSITEWVEGDYSGPDHNNVFTAVAEDNDGTDATDNDDATVDFTDVAPTILVTKTPSVASVPETGGNVTFTFTVQNTSSEEAVTILSLSDSIYGTLAGDADCMVGTVLAASATCEFSITEWVEGDYSGPDHDNVFTAVAEDNDGTDATDNDDATVDFTDVAPTILVTKTPSVASVPETGGNVTFTFTVQNTSSEEAVTILSLSDSIYGTLAGDADCMVGTVLAASATCEFSITEWVEGDYSGPDHDNVFTAVAEDNDGTDATDNDDATVDFTDVAPTILVTKTPSVASVPETGGNVTFTFTVQNTSSEEAVTILSLSDSIYGTLAGDADCMVGTVLAASASCEFSITEWVEGDYSGPDHNNVFTAVAEDNDGTDATDNDDATVDFTDVAPTILVTKTPSVASVPETGGNVTFTFTVQNTSSEEAVTILSLSDSIYGTLAGDADCMVGTVLAATASCEFSITEWVEGDYSGPDHVNVFTAVAEDNDGTDATDNDDATVDFTDVAPTILVTKTPSVASVPETGGNVTFTFTVQNTSSEEAVTILSLSDSIYGTLAGDADCMVGTVLAASASCEFSITEWVEGDYSGPDHVNVFTAVAEDNDGTDATDNDDATVDFTDVAPTILVTKTPSVASVPETGGNVTFTFTVQNTSSEEAVTILSLSDSIYGTLAGDADCMVGTVLAASASCEFSITEWVEGDYSGPDHVNVFTAVAEDNDGTDATDNDDATVDFTDVAPTILVTKTPSVASVPETGGNVTFTFTVQNTSSEEAGNDPEPRQTAYTAPWLETRTAW